MRPIARLGIERGGGRYFSGGARYVCDTIKALLKNVLEQGAEFL